MNTMLAAEDRIVGVVQGYARVIDRFGEKIGARPMVLPTGDFFPDAFTGDQQSVQALFARMKEHAGLGDLAISVNVVGGGGHAGHGGGCGGSCACDSDGGGEPPAQRLVRDENGWHLTVLGNEVRAPEVLTTHMARGLAVAFLAEASDGAAPSPAMIDLAAVALGFGALLLEGSYVYRKSCGGPSIAHFTVLGTEDLAIAFALFAALGGHPPSRAQRELGPTQRAAVGEAWAWVDSNRDLADRLKRTPGRVAAGDFEICETRPWLVRRLFKPKRSRKAGGAGGSGSDDSLEAFEAALAGAPVRAKTKPVDPKLDEIKKLVDEACGAP
jgi:hypothetical protein